MIELYGNNNNTREVITSGKNISSNSPVKGKDENKLLLEKDYDYVVAACMFGCNEKVTNNNTFMLSSTRTRSS